MWKKVLVGGMSLVALQGAAQSAIETGYVNQTLDEVSRDALSSIPVLKELSLVFDESKTSLEQNRVVAKFVASSDRLKIQGGSAQMQVEVDVKAGQQSVNGQREVSGSAKAELKTEVVAVLKEVAQTQQSVCVAMSSRAENYRKFLDQVSCPYWTEIEKARSMQSIASVLRSLQTSLIAQLPQYIKTAQGSEKSEAERDLKIVQSLKIEQPSLDQLSVSASGDLVIAPNSTSQTSAKMLVTERGIKAQVQFKAQVDEAQFQKDKKELVQWMTKMENKDSDLLNVTRLKIYEIGESLNNIYGQK